MTEKDDELTAKRLCDKSKEAFLLAVELYNRPTIKYRVEGCAFFLCNAWELLLKAYLVTRYGGRSIYYENKPDRTLSLDECISRVFTNKTDPLRQNLERVIDLRNTSTHFVVEEFEGIYAPLLQACVENYDDKARALMGIEISDLIPENYLVLSVRRGTVDMEECRARYGSEVVNKMISLRSGILSSEDLENNRRYACSYVTELRMTKHKDADLTLRIDKGSDEPVALIKQLVNPEDKYPYRTKAVVEVVNKRLLKEGIKLSANGVEKARFTSSDFQLFIQVYDWKHDERYSINTSMEGEQARYAYSQQAIDDIVAIIRQEPDLVIDRLKAEVKKR
ncbi:DUF3644 domain-containing protein [Paratractidigestivibacter sp.]|uniref:DUF3644 domain-containing protein n=1 Tax=Paratractidigestivibacter sp. TaxID=2847316 RepID=UPI002AC93E17|nr:DUF3644 domain-containing protein [Paratractidigestivibacter sp.]